MSVCPSRTRRVSPLRGFHSLIVLSSDPEARAGFPSISIAARLATNACMPLEDAEGFAAARVPQSYSVIIRSGSEGGFSVDFDRGEADDGPVCPSRTRRVSPLRVFHSLIVLSSDPEARAGFPSISIAARLATWPVCPLRTRRVSPLRVFHSLIVLSRDPEARAGFPSILIAARLAMSALCPSRTRRVCRCADPTVLSCCRLILKRGRVFRRFRSRRGW